MLARIPYAIGQASRVRRGLGAIAGNYVVMSQGRAAHVALVHLKAGSIRVSVGKEVAQGEHVADCRNSGDTTEPHLHVQAMDRVDPMLASGLQMVFSGFRELRRGASEFVERDRGIPAEGSIIEPLPLAW